MDDKGTGPAPRSIGSSPARRGGCGNEAAGDFDETLGMAATTDKWISSRGEREAGKFFAHKGLMNNT
jgi:hypothetical protein